jgi:hypothetical protein
MEGFLEQRRDVHTYLRENVSFDEPVWMTMRRHELVYAPFDPTEAVGSKKGKGAKKRAPVDREPIDLRKILSVRDKVAQRRSAARRAAPGTACYPQLPPALPRSRAAVVRRDQFFLLPALCG